MMFVECSAPENFGRKSKSNERQANLCHEVCRLLTTEAALTATKSKSPGTTTLDQQLITVQIPYSRQVKLLKSKLSHFTNVEASSIDGFRGREADIVVFVTVRCNVHYEIGFLNDLRRMNVALTRAKTGVISIGNRATLTTGTADPENMEVWRRLLATLVEIKIETTK